MMHAHPRTSAPIQDRPTFVAFLTAGYPRPADTVDLMLALERGGVDVIELGNAALEASDIAVSCCVMCSIDLLPLG